MVFTRKKARAGANPESPPRIRPGTNIREVHTHIQIVFKKGKKKIFIQRVLQYSQEANGGELHYLVLGLNYSSTEDDMKNPIVLWLLDFTLTEISIHKFLMC